MNDPNPRAGEPYTDTWRTIAACRGMPTHLFYATAKGDKCTKAKKVCKTCPVQAECLQEGDEQYDMYSIRGGLGPRQRARLRVARGNAA